MAKLVKANDDGKPILGEECDGLDERLLLGWTGGFTLNLEHSLDGVDGGRTGCMVCWETDMTFSLKVRDRYPPRVLSKVPALSDTSRAPHCNAFAYPDYQLEVSCETGIGALSFFLGI